MITVIGDFKDSLSYFRFLNEFSDSKLAKLQHQEKQPNIDYLKPKIKVELFFCDSADEILELSIKNGILKPWKDEIKIKDSMSNILEKYTVQ